jgi:hypothetical protein
MRLICLLLLALVPRLAAADDWQDALSRMPLQSGVHLLTRSNCVAVMLDAFQSNATVKALIFMPGATDEFYMFRRARAVLTNASPTLLDAVMALTNQTYICASFRSPFVLLHTEEDPLDSLETIKDDATAEKLRRTQFIAHVIYNDRDWDSLLFPLQKSTGVFFSPRRYSMDSFHFYRHSFAAWNLSNWEALEALTLAGKTKFTIEHHRVVFEGDNRVIGRPNLGDDKP